jgi:LysM domain
MNDDEQTRILPGGDDPEQTGRLWPPPDGAPVQSDDQEPARFDDQAPARSDAQAPPPDDQAPTRQTGAGPEQTVRYEGSPRDWAQPDASPPPRDWSRPEAAPARPAPEARPRAARPLSVRSPAARIAAPVVFLVAVVALFSLTMRSGVLKNHSTAKTGGGAATSKPAARYYVVKPGDSLSQIAVRHHTDVATLLRLNPRMSETTLTIGEKIKLPTQ